VARDRLVEELTREGKEARIYAYAGWEDSYFQTEWRKLGEQPGYFWLADEIPESGAFGDPSQATAQLHDVLH